MLTSTEIAAARADLNRHFLRNLRIAFTRAVRGLRFVFERMAEAQRHRREIEFLLHADERVLKDIGVTRADVHFALGAGHDAALRTAAQARDEARNAPIEQLPQVASPALAPAMPRQPLVHENFR